MRRESTGILSWNWPISLETLKVREMTHLVQMRILITTMESAIWTRGTKCYQSYTCYWSTAKLSFSSFLHAALFHTWSVSFWSWMSCHSRSRGDCQRAKGVGCIHCSAAPFMSTGTLSIMLIMSWAEAALTEPLRLDSYRITGTELGKQLYEDLSKPLYTKLKNLKKKTRIKNQTLIQQLRLTKAFPRLKNWDRI